MLRELEIELSRYLDEQRALRAPAGASAGSGPRTWRAAWLRVIDGIAGPFEKEVRRAGPNQEAPEALE